MEEKNIKKRQYIEHASLSSFGNDTYPSFRIREPNLMQQGASAEFVDHIVSPTTSALRKKMTRHIVYYVIMCPLSRKIATNENK